MTIHVTVWTSAWGLAPPHEGLRGLGLRASDTKDTVLKKLIKKMNAYVGVFLGMMSSLSILCIGVAEIRKITL